MNDNLVTIIGSSYFEAISVLLEKLEKHDKGNSNEVQSGHYVNGFASSVCLLAVVCLESYVMRVRYINKATQKQVDKVSVPDYLKSLYQDFPYEYELLEITGRSQEAVASIKRAMSLNPRYPDWYWQELGFAPYVSGQHTEAIDAFNRIANIVEFDYAYLAACHVALGEVEQAKSHVANLIRMMPRASIRYYEKTQPYKNDADLKRFLNALREAGLVESHH